MSENFQDWAGFQSVVSLIVAVIALVGVLVTTFWNNHAADARRKEDQKSADERRKEDIAAEKERRRADYDRRDSEYEKQVQRDFRAHQRREIAKVVREVIRAADEVMEHRTPRLSQAGTVSEPLVSAHIWKISRFFLDAETKLVSLELEVANQRVRDCIKNLRFQICEERKEFRNDLDSGAISRSKIAEETPVPSDKFMEQLFELIDTARVELLEERNETRKF